MRDAHWQTAAWFMRQVYSLNSMDSFSVCTGALLSVAHHN